MKYQRIHNTAFRKLAENPQRLTTEYLTDDQVLELKEDPERHIVEIQRATEGRMLVKSRPRQEAIYCNRFSNLVHAAFITSGARLLLLSLMEKVGDACAYTDTGRSRNVGHMRIYCC